MNLRGLVGGSLQQDLSGRRLPVAGTAQQSSTESYQGTSRHVEKDVPMRNRQLQPEQEPELRTIVALLGLRKATDD